VARTKTTETSSITAAQLADGDLIPVIDVSDTTMSSTGTNKKLAKSQLAEAAGVTAHAAVTSSVHGISAFGATLVDDADAATARSTLGLGTIATQAAGAVAITGGSVTGITDLAVADGGTGGSTAATALANLTSTTLAADGDILTRSGGTPAPITRANLAADEAFTSRFATPRGARVAIIGDSIARGNGTWKGVSTDLEWKVGAFDWLAQALRGSTIQGKANYVQNAGVGGQTTAQMLARFDTDITPYDPGVVVIGGGTNDTGVGTSLSTFATNIKGLVAKVRSIGAIPILVLAPPNDTTTGGRLTDITTFNMWLRHYAGT